MHLRTTTGSLAIKGFATIVASAVLLLLMICFVPQYALANEQDQIPQGVLRLCDNPFDVDCDSAQCTGDITVGEKDLEVIQDDYPSSTIALDDNNNDEQAIARDSNYGNALNAPSEKDVEESLIIEEPTTAHKDEQYADSDSSNLQNSSSSDDSKGDSKHAKVNSSASGDARVVVEDEGLSRHEQSAILAEFAPGISRSALNDLVISAGGLGIDDIADEDLASGLVRLNILDGSSVLETIERIKNTPGFLNAQPNYVYHVQQEEDSYTVVDDTYATRQWGLYDANVYAAWDLAKANGSVAVAVIDTGVDLDHPDLAPNIVATHNSYSAVNTVQDQVGHGTHVAGIISGVANNGIGVAGTSYNANLVIIKAASYKSNDFDSISLARAFSWLESLDASGKTVAEHYNVRIVNMSICGYDDTRSSNIPDDVLNQAITKARNEYGLLTVVAAGNGLPYAYPYYAYPSDSEACFSVMNLAEMYNDDGEPIGIDLDCTSNYNVPGTDYKDICAPGTDIYSTWINGKYAIDSGTSMAAPFVSGVAALLLAVNPYLTPQMIMSIIEYSAFDMGDAGWDELYGYGEVDAAAAVRIANASRIDGSSVVGVGGTAYYSASLGLGMEEDGSGRTWDVWSDDGGASVNNDGELYGWYAGEVTLVSTCTATTGAEISATKNVYVLDTDIVGDTTVSMGVPSSVYTTTDPRWTWVWQVDNYTGKAHIDQDAILIADKPGIVYVTATCATNTDIVLEYRVVITE